MKRVRIEPHTCQYKFGDRIKVLRKKKGLTQKDLAESFPNLTMDTVKNWEQHYCIPEIDTLYELCEFFECDMDYLLGRIDARKHDIQDIHAKIGLSIPAIESLEKEMKYNKWFIDIGNVKPHPSDMLSEIIIGWTDAIKRNYEHLAFLREDSTPIIDFDSTNDSDIEHLNYATQHGNQIISRSDMEYLCIDTICYEIKKILNGDIQKK